MSLVTDVDIIGGYDVGIVLGLFLKLVKTILLREQMNLRLKEIYCRYYYYNTDLLSPTLKSAVKMLAHVIRHSIDDAENHMTPYFTRRHQVKIVV